MAYNAGSRYLKTDYPERDEDAVNLIAESEDLTENSEGIEY